MPPEVLQKIAEELDAGAVRLTNVFSFSLVHRAFVEPSRKAMVREIKWPFTRAGADSMLAFFEQYDEYRSCVSSVYSSFSMAASGDRIARFVLAAPGLRKLKINVITRALTDFGGVVANSASSTRLQEVWVGMSSAVPEREFEEAGMGVLDCVLALVGKSNATLTALHFFRPRHDYKIPIALPTLPPLPALTHLSLENWGSQTMSAFLRSSAGGVTLDTADGSDVLQSLDEEALSKVTRLHLSEAEDGYPPHPASVVGRFRNAESLKGWRVVGELNLRLLPERLVTLHLQLDSHAQLRRLLAELGQPGVLPHLKSLTVTTWLDEYEDEDEDVESGSARGPPLDEISEAIRAVCLRRGCEYDFY